ncbi:hypothetical protein DM01DRAFT_316823 [Hesseltinella vesiculosa]|uniref:Barwin domain-containing protein n=1 Tax=Hesseltinella vesiculosa TaxID=101127 RepID=A0A1X2G250_9FUNG|nr:hypothetical protein DM01DRAFT_316823 [Hesseltinella vesiculosa]
MRFNMAGVFMSVFLFVALAEAEGLVTRGKATMMNFEEGKISKRGRGTWYLDPQPSQIISRRYSGKDLTNAACYGREGLPSFSARVTDMIGAMAMNYFEYCYKCMEITNAQNKRKVTVKIVDKCAACKVGTAIDLTPGAFKRLSKGLDEGVLDIKWKVVRCPRSIRLALS